jgi:hypothetical protein
MLTVSQLSKSFAGHLLFDDVSLQVNRADQTHQEGAVRTRVGREGGMSVRAYFRQSEMFFSRLIVRAVELTIVVAAVNQYQ